MRLFLSRIFLYLFLYWFIEIFLPESIASRSSSARNRQYFVEWILNAVSRGDVESLVDFYDRLYIEATFTACVFCCSHSDIALGRQEPIYAYVRSLREPLSSAFIPAREAIFFLFFLSDVLHRAKADAPCSPCERTQVIPRQDEE